MNTIRKIGAAIAPTVGAAFLPPRDGQTAFQRGGRNAAPTMLALSLLLALAVSTSYHYPVYNTADSGA